MIDSNEHVLINKRLEILQRKLDEQESKADKAEAMLAKVLQELKLYEHVFDAARVFVARSMNDRRKSAQVLKDTVVAVMQRKGVKWWPLKKQ